MAAASSALVELRERLVRLGFHAPSHTGLMGMERGTPEERLASALEATGDGTPLSTALRLFSIGVAVERSGGEAALGPALVARLIERGVLIDAGGNLRSACAITFTGDMASAQDFVAVTPEGDRDDFVAPVAGGTRILSLFTVPPESGRGSTLEIGTGQGLPLALAAGHSKRAVGTDVSERALWFARVTAELNGRDHAEFRLGSLFEPLDPQVDRFDTIIANPPFVIAPEGASALTGAADASITERVVRGVGAHLSERGFATILGNWGHRSEEDWDEPIRGWTSGCGCDAMVVRLRCESARAYAISWRREMRMLRPFREPAPLDAWESMLRLLGFEWVTMGLVFLRRSSGEPWFHGAIRSTAGAQPGAGRQIRRLFDGRTRVTDASEDSSRLLEVKARLCPTIELVGRPTPRGRSEWGVSSGTLRQTEGWPEPIAVDGVTLAVLMGCDGRRSIREIIASVASDQKASAPALERSIGSFLPRWFEAGYLY